MTHAGNSQKLAQIRALMFDFDGVIADSTLVVYSVINELAAMRGVTPMPRSEMVRLTFPEIMKAVGIERDAWNQTVVWARLRMSDLLHLVRPCEQLRPGLAQARARRLVTGVFSSNGNQAIQTFLQRHWSEHHFDVLHTDLALFNKGQAIAAWLTSADLAPHQVAYVGDEVRDIEAARHAGVHSIAVTWGQDHIERLRATGPDFLVSTGEELAALLTL